MNLMYDFIFWISIFSYIVPAVFILKSKVKLDVFFTLLFYSILCFATELTSLQFMSIYKNNNPVIHVYTVLAFIAISYLYHLLFKTVFIRNVILFLNLLFIPFAIYIFFHDSGFLEVNTSSYLILTLFTVVLSSGYFYKVYTEMKIANLFQDGLFWINSAFLIYFSTTFYVSLFEDLIKSVSLQLFYYTWPIQLISTIIFNIILSRGIWLMKKQLS